MSSLQRLYQNQVEIIVREIREINKYSIYPERFKGSAVNRDSVFPLIFTYKYLYSFFFDLYCV